MVAFPPIFSQLGQVSGCAAVGIGQTVWHPDVVVGEVQRLGRRPIRDRFPQELPADVDVAMGFCNLCRYSVVEVWRGGVFVVATGLLGENRLFTFSFSYVSGGNYDLCRSQSLQMR